MSQGGWTVIYRVSLVVFLMALMGLLVQAKNIGTMPMAIAATLSGLICLLAYKRKSDSVDASDFARMLDNPGATNIKSARPGKAARDIPENTANIESVIVGVVGPVGASGSMTKMQVFFELNPWRIKGGAVQEDALTVRLPKPVRQSEYDEIVSKLAQENMIIEISAGEPVDGTDLDGKTAQLVKIVSIGASDSELERIAIERTLPVDFEFDGKHVRFSIDEEEGIFAGTVRWLDKDVRLYLDTGDSRQTPAYANHAAALLADAQSWSHGLREKITGLLAEETRKLLRPDDRNKSPDAILARLCLHDIHVLDEGELVFNFTPGDVFPDKEIAVYGDLKEGLGEAALY